MKYKTKKYNFKSKSKIKNKSSKKKSIKRKLLKPCHTHIHNIACEALMHNQIII